MFFFSEPERRYSIYVRTNRRVQWHYAAYHGRWATPEEAVEKATERMGDSPFEYLINDLADAEFIKTGFVNWQGK